MIYIKIIILVIQLLILIYLSHLYYIEHYDSNVIQICRINTSNKSILKLPINVLDAIKNDSKFAIASSLNEADMIMFDTLNDIENVLMNKFIYPQKAKYVFAFKGIDMLASKVTFTNMLEGTKIIPLSYDITNKEGFNKLVQDFHTVYVLKKNIQQQKGILIISSVKELVHTLANDNEYVVCQELLRNPMLIGGRKINIRIYLLITLDNKECEFYMYNDGFMYYAPKEWDIHSYDPDIHITTGLHKTREIYKANPLTYQDLKQKLSKPMSELLEKNIKDALLIVKSRYKSKLLQLNKGTPVKNFSLFGVDIAPTKDAEVHIMEINKGPDLTYKDERDGQLKSSMTQDMLSLVCDPTIQNGFIKII